MISLPAQATDCPWPEAYDGTVEALESLLPDQPLKGNESVHISIDCTTTVAPGHCAELNRQVNAYLQCRIAEARRPATTPSTQPTPGASCRPPGQMRSSFSSLALRWPAAAQPWQLQGVVRRAEQGASEEAPLGSRDSPYFLRRLMVWVLTGSKLWPLPCERKHPHLDTSGNASIAPLTLAFAVVACRLVPSGCRFFAACSPPGGWPVVLSVTVPRRACGNLPTAGTNTRRCP